MRTVLGNVERMRRDYPGFEAPPAEYREGLQPGDLAELMFLSEEMNPEGEWAQVLEVPEPGLYRGILESGEEIEFGPENVADLKTPGPQMGVTPFSYFGSGQVPEKKPSIWEWEDHALWVEEQRRKKAEERAAHGEPPKRGFWERIFRRKPKEPEVEVSPIPEEEVRRPPPGLPYGFQVPSRREEEPPSPIMPPETPEEPEVVEEEEEVVHGEPIRFSELLSPPPAAPGVIILPERLPSVPGGGVIMPEPGEAQQAFQVVKPKEVTQFSVIETKGQPLAPIEEVRQFGEVSAPPPPQTKQFDVLQVPTPGQVIVRPQEVTTFSEVIPVPQELAPYQEASDEPRELVIPREGEELWAPTHPQVAEEIKEAKKPKKKKKVRKWMSVRSSIGDWVEWIENTFKNLDELWEGIRVAAADPYYEDMRRNERATQLDATIAIETFRHDKWKELFDFLDIPHDEYESYLERIERDDDNYEQAWEDFQHDLLEPLSVQLESAFDKLKPRDLPGNIYLGYDGGTENKYYGLVYRDSLSEEEQARIEKEEEEAQKEAVSEFKKRKKKIEKIWGPLPTKRELVGWAEATYDKAFWSWLRKTIKSEGFHKEMEEAWEERGEPGVLEAVEIAEEGPDLYDQLGTYFAIPLDVFGVYFDSMPPQEAQNKIWNEFLYSYFRMLDSVMNDIKPRGVHGYFEFAWDEDDQIFMLKYMESLGGEE